MYTIRWEFYIDTYINPYSNLGGRYSQCHHFIYTTSNCITEVNVQSFTVLSRKWVSGRIRIWTQAVCLQSWCHSPSFLSPLFIFKTPSHLSFSLITLGGLNKMLFDAEPHFSIANKWPSFPDRGNKSIIFWVYGSIFWNRVCVGQPRTY